VIGVGLCELCRLQTPYRSGKQCGWVKVKCEMWRDANRERWQLFERRR
jgi:hypothetical protein